MSRKTNPVGLRLGLRYAWLSDGGLGSYSEHTRRVLFVRSMGAGCLKRLRMQPIVCTTHFLGRLLQTNLYFSKRRIKRRGSRLTIRRRLRLRWRRWGRIGARSIDKLKPMYGRRYRRRYSVTDKKHNFLKRFWSKIPSRNLRRYWRFVVCGRIRRHKRRIFWLTIKAYLHNQNRSRALQRTNFNFFLLRNPIVSELRRLKKVLPDEKQVLNYYSSVFARFSRSIYFRRRFRTMMDDAKRIKWARYKLRNVPRYILSAVVALWLPSASVLSALICHALRAHRWHWRVLRFFDRLIFRLQSFNTSIRGIRIEIRGKFNKRLRTVKITKVYGLAIPANTFDTNFDYSFRESYTYLGVFSVRVWFYLFDSISNVGTKKNKISKVNEGTDFRLYK